VKKTAQGGWIGITDKYWLAALVPDQKVKGNLRFTYRKESGDDLYQVDYLSNPLTVAPGGTVESRNRLFTGAKEVTIIDAYNEDLGIDRFDLAIDFGWFYFLTKPIFYALLYINEVVLNFGLSILLLTVAIKIVFFPLANKSYTSMSKMKKLQPEVNKLRERFGDDKTKLNEEMMALYKRENANPASGCLPILIQIPVFFALYKVLFVNIEMRHAPFFGWIKDLSVADPTSVFNLFGMIPWTPPDFLMVGVWPLIMGASMYLQQKLNPQPSDPMQAKIFQFLPIIFTFLLARFPAGLVIYWAWNNILSMAQQWVIMRRMGITGKQALK
ncbi:MAG TPA: membrane protein insertase YidC, partial [Rhodospirillales bacterium]|nr:membrane protein insertase YidC [Rhodospirillales bacterium]